MYPPIQYHNPQAVKFRGSLPEPKLPDYIVEAAREIQKNLGNTMGDQSKVMAEWVGEEKSADNPQVQVLIQVLGDRDAQPIIKRLGEETVSLRLEQFGVEVDPAKEGSPTTKMYTYEFVHNYTEYTIPVVAVFKEE